MKYVIEPSPGKNEWVVEIYDEDGKEDVCVATFSGRGAITRAFEYVSWTHTQNKAARAA